jgi:hypothetical protein
MASYHLSLKSGKPGKAANHASYIARQGKHSQDEDSSDLIATGHDNMPEWAQNDPLNFWKAADKYERVNGAAYREFELALPLELSLEQSKEMLLEFIDKELSGKAYQFAIHNPQAAFGGLNQPHAHIMYSDRMLDGIDRSREQHFRRHNPANPELGGCKKDSGGKDRSELRNDVLVCRENLKDIQNKYLEKNGFSARVDHRSHKDRGIDKEPERHLGQARVKQMCQGEKALFLSNR